MQIKLKAAIDFFLTSCTLFTKRCQSLVSPVKYQNPFIFCLECVEEENQKEQIFKVVLMVTRYIYQGFCPNSYASLSFLQTTTQTAKYFRQHIL